LAATGGAVILTGLAVGAAYAGAWTEEQGSGQAVLGGTFTTSDHSYAADGRPTKASPFDKTDIDLYGEYGVRDWLTAIVQGGVTNRRVGEPNASSFEGADVTEAGDRIRLWQHGDAVFSFQTTELVPGGGHGNESAQYGNTDAATDLRALVGYSFKLGQWDSFVDGEAAYRIRGGRPPSEFHFDLTLGTRPRPNVLIMLQSFNVVSQGSGGYGFPRTSYSRLEASLVFDINKSWSIQLGVIATIAGENALRERGAIATVWRRF
jgi:protein XagA